MKILLTILLAAIFYGGQSWFYKKYWNKGLIATLSFSRETCQIGENVYLNETVSNLKKLPLSRLHVKFTASNTFEFASSENAAITDHYYRNDVFTLLSYQTTKRTLSFQATKRGYFTLTELDLIASDIFLKHTFACQLKNHSHLYVYPKLLEQSKHPDSYIQWLGNHFSHRSLWNDPLSCKGSRPYIPGDNLHFINWKQSARYGSLYTNLTEPVMEQEITILCNLNPFYDNNKDVLLEYIISIAATLITGFIKSGITVHFYSNAKDIITKETLTFQGLCRTSQLEQVMKGLARIDLNMKPDNFHHTIARFKKKYDWHSSLLFLSNDRTEQLVKEYKELKQYCSQSLFLLPEFASVPVKTEPSLFVKWEVPL